MISVGYHSPLVPPEWIAAHALAPRWLRLGGSAAATRTERLENKLGTVPTFAKRKWDCPPQFNPVRRGQCPFAATVAAAASSGAAGDALLLTTTCDQMRYTAAALMAEGAEALFLMHVPATWQTQTARQLYRDELLRLGRFLERLGGTKPTEAVLRETMQTYEWARADLLSRRSRLSARRFAEELAAVRSRLGACVTDQPEPGRSVTALSSSAVLNRGPRTGADTESFGFKSDLIPLALLGGPVTAGDATLLDAIEAAGGRIVLDASEAGERTLPAPFNRSLAEVDPLGALVEGYFGAIVDVCRRPVDPLYDWLAREIAARGIRGVIFRRYLSCDLWLAELHPLRARLSVPVLDLDAVQDEHGAEGRALGRIEAFLETLR
ncbi:MAG: 2-hydroxyacyl-CoA dehydratase [Planctomycetota bacterium]